jgi:hypothetical protein
MFKEYDLILKFKLRSWEELDPAALAKMLRGVLRDWDEGRYPFEAEMISAGLDRCLRRAVYNTVEEEAREEFGNELVPNNAKGNTSRAYLEAEKRYAVLKKPWFMPEPEVEIT